MCLFFSDNATSLGAAAAAGVGIGLYRDLEEAAEKIKDGACLAPDPAHSPPMRIQRRATLPSIRP